MLQPPLDNRHTDISATDLRFMVSKWSLFTAKCIEADTPHRLLDSLHLILITHAVYFYAITNFSNAAALLDVTWYVASVQRVT